MAPATKNIKKIDLSTELQANFLNYAEEVIKNRAIPDIRDGLKPVHRRILWTMWDMGCKPDSTMKKCARVVGDCFKYHPHGDVAIYEALVRMAQPFSIGIPLIKGQGNFGSIDDSGSFASFRYTECKLSEFSEAVLFADIDDECVEFIDNYTGEFKEPVVLPARIPLMLLTGSNGIAVGMKTDILPHNLKEVCAGLVAYVKDNNITLKQLMKHIPAPDFPLGGTIKNTPEIYSAYNSGNGLFDYKVVYEIEDRTIIIRNIPYMQNKSDVIANIGKLVREEKIQGIGEIRDESVKDDIRVCIDLKRGGDVEMVIRDLNKYTDLSKNFQFNNIAIVNQKPKLAGLVEVFKAFVDFRRDVITKRTASQKKKAERKKEILDATITAVENAETFLKIIKTADQPVEALSAFKPANRPKLNQAQAEYVYNMPMRRFSKQDVNELTEQERKTAEFISAQASILADKQKIDSIIIDETKDISKRFGYDRRTLLV